ncbi:Inorganic phosphate transporter pho84 [Orbilia oligospora]|uniref:Inorganic phosphate transporter pho84 n=1 Tax=Orbilia oligospora TaxID=2813651 RepID=A0A7C8JIH9_ORBOL|nr:Inorganic phosphate transporter pho84 [Orbilia oligospora]KAF3132171.1 Inorganic phosphate transporter pho84 [Orbilia oligospora]
MKWEEEGFSRYDVDEHGNPITFEQYDQNKPLKGKLNFLTRGELKLLLIAGVGFFLDSYDLFIINLVTPVWIDEYWGGNASSYPFFLRGCVNGAANFGNVIGQLSFGFLGDAFGRRFVYGKELIICIIGMIMVISLPNSIPTPHKKMVWILCWRIFMGVGIGGDYPMSASITSERTHLRRRGILLGFIFSNQGWGTLAGSIVTIVVLAAFQKALNVDGHEGQLDAVWRIQMGVAIIPAIATLWPRLTMPEGKQFLQSQELNSASTSSSSVNAQSPRKVAEAGSNSSDTEDSGMARKGSMAPNAGVAPPAFVSGSEVQEAKFNTFFVYFSEWRHFKTLFGTAMTWFLVDIAFYGINLNQSFILSAIGFTTGKNNYHKLMKNALGNLIIAVAGYVPGYFFTIAFIEILGRKTIQIGGFLITALLFGVLAGDYHNIPTAGKFVCFAFAQFFFNFGPNATTFIVPAEVFPSRVRGFAHGLSAAVGKLGAILSAILFNWLASYKIGLPNVLWIFFGCNVLGAIITYFFIPETKGRDADVVDYEEWLEANPGAKPNTRRAEGMLGGKGPASDLEREPEKIEA